MSLVWNANVESGAGRWYWNPIIRGPDWFICWDDEEPIEVVIGEGAGRRSMPFSPSLLTRDGSCEF